MAILGERARAAKVVGMGEVVIWEGSELLEIVGGTDDAFAGRAGIIGAAGTGPDFGIGVGSTTEYRSAAGGAAWFSGG